MGKDDTYGEDCAALSATNQFSHVAINETKAAYRQQQPVQAPEKTQTVPPRVPPDIVTVHGGLK